MKKSKSGVRASQLKWSFALTGYCQLVVLGSIIGSYVICLYLLCFDNRIWENLAPIIAFSIFDGIYFLDTVLRFASIYQDRTFPAIDTKPKSCCRWSQVVPLLVDLVSLIPGEAFIFIWTKGEYPQNVTGLPAKVREILLIFACLRSNRLLRVYRILAYYRHETMKIRLNLYEREIRAIMVSFLSLVTLIFHGIASAWYALSCEAVFMDRPPKCVNSLEVSNMERPFYQHINASLPDAWGRYVASLHWSVMTIKNSGNAYIVPITTVELATAMAFMLIGFLLTSSIICMGIYVMGQIDLCRSIYFHEVLGVSDFVSHLNMGGHVTAFLHDCFNNMWLRGKAFTDVVIKSVLPRTVRIDIAMSIFQPMVEASEVLQTLKREALEALSLQIEFLHYFPNEFIIRPHTVGFAMYYIMEGNIEVIRSDLKPILALSKGSLIGECNLAVPTYREHGIKTSTACEVLKLSWSNLISVALLDPNARNRMLQIVKKRMKWRTCKKKTDNQQDPTTSFQPPRSNFLALLANRDPSLNTDSTHTIDSPVSSGGSIDSQGYRTKVPLMIRQNLATPGLHSTQFMNLFAWLKLNKGDNYERTTNKEFLAILEKMNSNLRNNASLRSYNVLPTLTIPLYYWRYGAISRETYTFMFWDLLVVLTIAFYTVAYPICLVIIDESISQPIFVVVDIIYIADLIFRVFVFRERSEMSPLASMTQHFFTESGMGSIWFDIIPAFPLHNIAFIVTVEYDQAYLYLRLHMLCKFVKLIMRFRKWEHDVTMNTMMIRFSKHVIFITVIIVFVACNFVQQRCSNVGYDDCVFEAFEKNSTFRSDPDRYNFGHGSILEIFLYWAVCVIFGIGFTDVITTTIEETTIHTIALLIGFFFLVYCYSDFAAAVVSAVENKINHQDTRIWLHQFLDGNLTELELIARVDRYMDVQWQVLRGINADTATRSVGFLSVSHTMYEELMIHIMAESLYKTDLFNLLDADLMRKFCLTARLAVVPPNEVILASEDYVRKLYVIRRGTAEIALAANGYVIGTLSTGQSLGFGELLYGLRSKVIVTTLTYLEVIVVDAVEFDRILGNSKAFEEIWSALKSNAQIMRKFMSHFKFQEAHSYRKDKADYRNTSKEVYVYHSVLRRFSRHKDNFLETWRKLGIFYYFRYLMCPFTFIPTSKILRIWEGFRVLTIILMVIWLPLLEAFPALKKEYGPFVYVTDVVTIIDMLFRIHIAYYDSKTKDLITHPRFTAAHYFTTSFITDFIGGPLVYFAMDNLFKYSSDAWDTSIYAFLLRMNRMILLYHIYGSYSFTDRNSAFSSGQNSRRMVKLLPLFFFHAHMMACVMAVVTCPASGRDINYPLDSGLTFGHPYPRCKAGTWISLSRTLADQSPNRTDNYAASLSDIQIYVYAYYYTATTLVGCGFSDFLPANHSERQYMAALFFVYIFALAYIISTVVGSKCHLDYKLLKYQQEMSYLLGFLARERLTAYWTGSLLRYYDYQWLRTRGVQPQRMFYNLFPSLRKEAALSIFEDLVRQVPGLKTVTIQFVHAICVHLCPVYFLRENILSRQDDLCDTVYFVYRGTVLICHDTDKFREIGEGGTIGNLNPLAIKPTHFNTAIAITNVDLFSIKKTDFDRVVLAYPDAFKVFTLLAEQEASKLEPDQISTHRKFLEAKRRRKPFDRLGNTYLSGNDSIVQTTPSKATKILRVNMASGKRSLISRTGLKPFLKTAAPVHGYRSRSDMPMVEGVPVADYLNIDDPDVSPFEDSAFTQFIFPESHTIRFLNIGVFIAASLSLGIVSYQASFKDENLVLFGIGYICDAIYLMKMFCTFRLSYFNEFGDLIVDYSEIENKYLSHPFGFAWDFFSTFPLEIVTPFAKSAGFETLEFLSLLRLNRVLRVVQTWTFFGIKRCKSGVLINLLRMKLVRLLSLTGIYIHLAACVLQIYTVRINCGECSPAVTNETWFNTKKVLKGDPREFPYVFTLYFIVSTFTTTAYGDVAPVTKFEMLFTSFIAVSSKVWLALAVSDILSGLQNSTDITFHLSAQRVLTMYNDYGVSDEIQKKAEKYFTYAWVQNKGILMPSYLGRAPATMKMDIYSVIYGDHFRQSYLFRGLGETFIRHACIRIKHVYVLSGDYIIQQKEIDNAIYFVHRGFVVFSRTIMDKDGNTMEEDGVLSRYRYFGETQGLLAPHPHEYSFKAACNVDVLRISNQDLEEIFEIFPEHRETVLRRLYLKTTAAYLDPLHSVKSKTHQNQGNCESL